MFRGEPELWKTTWSYANVHVTAKNQPRQKANRIKTRDS